MGSGKAVENPKPPQNHKSLGEKGRAIGLLFGTGGRKLQENDGPGWKKHSSEPVEPTYAQPNQAIQRTPMERAPNTFPPKPGIAVFGAVATERFLHRKPPAPPYTLRASRWNCGFTLEGVSSVTKRPEPSKARNKKQICSRKQGEPLAVGRGVVDLFLVGFGSGRAPNKKGTCLKGLTWVDFLFFSCFFFVFFGGGHPNKKEDMFSWVNHPGYHTRRDKRTWTNYPPIPWNPTQSLVKETSPNQDPKNVRLSLVPGG